MFNSYFNLNKGVPEYKNIWYHNQLAPKGIGPYKAHQVRKSR
jgi:hypothetical protein